MSIVTKHILCRHCGYRLKGLTQARCPECGAAFNLGDPATFSTRRPFHWRGAIVVLAIVIPAVLMLLVGLLLAIIA